MADKGIIFSGPMVRALLAGTKTQTRRLFKPRGFEFYTHPVSGDRYGQYRPYRDGTWDQSRISGSGPMQSFSWGESLYAYLAYAPGDRLYVREAAQQVAEGYLTIYRADYPACVPAHFENVPSLEELKTPWRPSIHMPRAWSRLTLTVTDVRVQRLQHIDERDALAEGIIEYEPTEEDPAEFAYRDGGDIWNNARSAYAALWNSLHTKPGETWADDPWIVAVSFDVEQRNIDQVPA